MPWPGLTSNTPCEHSSVTVARPRGNPTHFRVHDVQTSLCALSERRQSDYGERRAGRALHADFLGNEESQLE